MNNTLNDESNNQDGKQFDFLDEIDQDEDDNKSSKRSMNPYTNLGYDKYSYTYRQFEPPSIPINPNLFMHSTVRSTEDDSREDIIINQISELKVNMNFVSKPIAWHYERFNSSNYIMVAEEQMISIWREPFQPNRNSLTFRFNKPFCQIDLRNKGTVGQSIFYTLITNFKQVLHIAFTIRTMTGAYKLKSYQVTGDSHCQLLDTFNFVNNNRPIKLDFISTYQFGSLAVLFEHTDNKPRIEFTKSELNEEQTKLVKIYARSAIDFEPFIVNGFAYLAVAYSNGAVIFKFDESITKHRLYDTIPIYNIRDLKSFRIGFKNFLAIATSDQYQHIFTWKSGSLLRYQVLNVTNVLQWQIIDLQTCRDDLLLGIVRNDPNYPLLIYTWDGVSKHFQLSIENVRKFTPNYSTVKTFSQTSFNYNTTAYVLEFSANYQPRILAIYSSIRQLNDPVFEKLQIVSSKIKSLFNSFIQQQRDINYVKNILDYAVKPNPLTVINANQRFKNQVDVQNSVDVNVISKMKRTIWQGTSLTLNDTNLDLVNAQNEINKLNLHANNLKSTLSNNVVFKDQPATISGNTVFSNGVSLLNKLNSNSMHITKVKNNPFTVLLNDLVYKDSNQVKIKGQKIFLSPIDIKGKLDVNNVNGINNFFDLAVRKNINQIDLNSPINFKNGFTVQNLDLTGKINNVNLTNDAVYFDQGPIRFNQPVKIVAFNTSVNSLNTTTINNVDLMNLYLTSLRTNGDQTMNSPLIIKEAVTLGNVNVLSNKLNQHNLAFLSNVLVRRDQPAQINSPTVFANSVHLTNNLNLKNYLNSLRIPADLVSKTRPNLIDGVKQFNGRIMSLEDLNVKGLINNVQYPQDVITLSLEEEILSPIIFENGFTTRKNVQLIGKVDGVKINDFSKYINSKFSLIPANAQFLGKVFIRNNLIVDGLVDNLNLTSFVNNLVYKNANSTLIISSPKVFRNGLQIRNGFVKAINGLRTSELLTTNSNQTVYTRLKTAAPVEFDNLYIYNRLINNFDLVHFAKNYISIRKPEFIVPNKRFEQIETTIFLKVNGRVNGLQPNQDFVLNDNVGQINSRVRFTRPVTLNSQLNTGSINVKSNFLNLNITDLLAKRIRLDTNDFVDYGVQLASSSIKHLNLFDNKLINGVNFNNLRANLLHKTGNQTIYGQKNFLNLVQFNQDVRSNLINNISMAYLRDNALRLTGDQVIENNVVFHDDVEVGKLNVGKLLNGINFGYLLSDGIRYNENVNLRNRTIFNAPIRFLSNVFINKLNGLDLNKDILHKSGYQAVKSNLFVDDLLVKGALNLKSGYVNGENLFKFENNVLRLDKPNIILGNLEIDKSVNVLAGTRVQGMINKVNLTKIIHNSLFKYGDQRLNFARIANVPTTFKKLYSFNVNGVNIRNFMNDIVFANSNHPQTINAPKYFKNVAMRGNYYLPNINARCLINGYDLNEMNANRVPINSSQPVVVYNDLLIRNNLYFNSDLTVAGRVNNINLITDAIPLNNKPLNGNLVQNIIGRKQFKNVIFENRLGIRGNLNSANLNELIESTMHRSSKETIEGVKHFKSKIWFTKLDVFNFNNERNRQSPFLDYRDLDKNSFTFSQPVEILGNLVVKGKVNNINLNQLYSDSLRYNKSQIIRGKLKFNELIVTKDAKFDGPLNGINVKELFDDIINFKSNEKTNALMLNKKIYDGIKLSRDLLKYLEHSTFRIDGLAFHQSLDGVFGDYINLYPLQIIDRIQNKIVRLQFNFQRNLFEKIVYNQMRKNYVRREALDDKGDFSIHLPEYDSNEQAVIRKKRAQVATIGKYVDQVRYLDLGNGQVLIGSLSAIYGKLDLRVLTKSPTNYTSYVKSIGSIQVGPMANNFVIFQIDKEIYLAVSRSFKNMCPLTDSGSFIFHWENRSAFRLIQRINLPNANNVVYYNFNDQHYLIFSNQRSNNDPFEDENLHIYRKSTEKSDCQFVLFQKLPLNEVEDFVPFTFGSIDKQELYLTAVNAHKLVVWKHTGHSGFGKYWVADLVSGKTVKPILFNNQLFFVVAQDYNCRGSYVFRALTKGTSFKPIALYDGPQFRNLITSIPEF